MARNSTDFAINITRFLKEYLPLQRNYSENTILSYRDTLKLLVRYIEKNNDINKFYMKDFNKSLVINFLEEIRNNGLSHSTANQRLAGIKSFATYCISESVENISQLQEIINIRQTKTKGKEINYLTEEQIHKIINAPDSNNDTGLRHKTVLCLLYDTGARVQEICDLKVKDVQFSKNPTIKLTGKGRKTRIIPISADLSKLLELYIRKFHPGRYSGDHYLIFNKNRQQITRDGIEYVVKKYAKMMKIEDDSFPERVHCHMFRHSKAVHMVSAEIPIIYIRDFLGHEDISTTMIYAKADIRSKQTAIDRLTKKLIDPEPDKSGDWTNDEDLMSFLNSL